MLVADEKCVLGVGNVRWGGCENVFRLVKKFGNEAWCKKRVEAQ